MLLTAPFVIIGLASIGMLGLVLFGATRIFRSRRVDMADLPELPPPSDKPGAGPSLRA